MGCLVMFILFIASALMLGGDTGSTIAIFVLLFIFGGMFLSQEDKSKKEVEKKKQQDRDKAHEKNIAELKPDKVIRADKVLDNVAIYISNFKKQVLFVSLISNIRVIYYFDELIECSIEEDGVTIESGGVGRAVVGGVLAGGVGAVVGAATRSSKPTTLSLSVRLVTRNLDRPLYKISIIKEATKRDSPEYRYRKRLAEQIYATMISIIKR